MRLVRMNSLPGVQLKPGLIRSKNPPGEWSSNANGRLSGAGDMVASQKEPRETLRMGRRGLDYLSKSSHKPQIRLCFRSRVTVTPDFATSGPAL